MPSGGSGRTYRHGSSVGTAIDDVSAPKIADQSAAQIVCRCPPVAPESSQYSSPFAAASPFGPVQPSSSHGMNGKQTGSGCVEPGGDAIVWNVKSWPSSPSI